MSILYRYGSTYYINMTNRCPCRCVFCVRDSTPRLGDADSLWLDHEPRDFKNAAAAGADLILSGHTHGGQVWPAGAVGMAARNERNYGKKQVTPGCAAIVSGGTGTWGYRFRTQGRTEIVCIEVESTAPEKT